MEWKLIERSFLLEEGRRHMQHTDVFIVSGKRILVLVTQGLISHT